MHNVSGMSLAAHTLPSTHPFENMNMKIKIIHTDAILQPPEVYRIRNKFLKIILSPSLKSESPSQPKVTNCGSEMVAVHTAREGFLKLGHFTNVCPVS